MEWHDETIFIVLFLYKLNISMNILIFYSIIFCCFILSFILSVDFITGNTSYYIS
ncbi:hypothetical protein DFP78_104144 [Photobacterium lutimaris]|nr:hypothetical protein DFP78_104144 [Photobacterium lutimaris]